MSKKISDAFSAPRASFAIEEGEGEVDGKHVLAKVTGEFFFPGGVSRNNRYYSPTLWKRQVESEDVKALLAERRMFGTISHDQKIDDSAILEGRISHIVTGLRIDGNKGIGEALILNTPAGRIANTLFRAGCKMFVSSRADGDFSGSHNGVPKVDDESYRLHTFDFVLDPGFLMASPALKESLNEDFTKTFGKSLDEVIRDVKPALPGSTPRIEEPDDLDEGAPKPKRGSMEPTKELLESMMRDKTTAEGKLTEVLGINERLIGEKAILEAEQKRLKEANEALETKLKALGDSAGKLTDIQQKLDGENGLGSPKEIQDTYTRINKHLERLHTAAGTKNMAEVYRLLEFSVSVTKDFGTLPEIKTAYAMMREAVAKWKELGSPKEVKDALTFADAMADQRMTSLVNERAARLFDETGIPTEVIAPMLALGQTEDQVRANLKKIGESTRSRQRYQTGPLHEGNKGDAPRSDSPSRSTFGQRLLESSQGATFEPGDGK